MKKIFALILTVILSVAFCTTSFAADNLLIMSREAHVEAIVISSRYNAQTDKFSFCVVADLSEFGYPSNGSLDPFTFSVSREQYFANDGSVAYAEYTEGDQIQTGMHIDIFWSGEFMESYPLQLGTVNRVVEGVECKVFEEGEFEEYYLMFYVELPTETPNYSTPDNYTEHVMTEDDVYEEENPVTGIDNRIDPMNIVLSGAGILAAIAIAIYLMTALLSKSN